MNKPFLLIAGELYYPSPKTGDWIARYTTREEAEAQVNKDSFGLYQIKCRPNEDFNWYCIVDLNEWGL